MSDHIVITTVDGVLRIVINRPQQLGAVTGHMLDAAADAIEHAGDSVRVVVITGTGRAFCSGADLSTPASEGGSVLAGGNRLILAMTAAPFPVIAAVNGLAAGIGASIALAADLTLAVDTSYFLLAFVNIGLMPDGGATELVAASIGRARANRMALLGERLQAPVAAEIGLIHKSLASEAYEEELAMLVDKLAHGPTRAYAATKRALNANTLSRLTESIERESLGQAELVASADYAEGKAAFLEKRPARFTGT
ncbi:enoyl-CoA hydratase [soil metagenome]